MRRSRLVALAAGTVIALGADRMLRLESAPRVDPRLPSHTRSAHPSGSPLPLRLVDLGAVGIPADTAA